MVHIYPGILQYDTTTWVDLAPDLAVSWEVDSTGKAYTFKVREGVTYSDGSPVSAEDMSYALNRMIERPNDIAMPRSEPATYTRKPSSPDSARTTMSPSTSRWATSWLSASL